MRAVAIDQFPGLDLRGDPGEARGAIDLTNVTIEPGRIRSRDGSSTFKTLAAVFLDRAPRPGGTEHLVSVGEGAPGTVTASTSAGTTIATTTFGSVTATGTSGVSLGTPSATYYYLTSYGAGANTVRRWDGTTWTTPAAFSAGIGVLGKTPTDNRLVFTAFSTQVFFSDPGAPETVGVNNYVHLDPGDGEAITAIVNFNNQMFVFKPTKFYVFFGQSADGRGEPVFNYRTVNTGIGVASAVAQAVCVGADGVYFVGPDGIYRTTGGPPVCISRPLDPFFEGTTNGYWQRSEWDPAWLYQRLAWHDGYLYAGLASDTIMVWDSRMDTWTMWGISCLSMTSLLINSQRRLLVGGEATVQRIDPGTAVTALSAYRSAFTDFGDPKQKMIRETVLEGTGTPSFGWGADWALTQPVYAVTLGTSPAPGTAHLSKAKPGRLFSFHVGASTGAWELYRVQPNLLESARPVSFT